jgi:hypothetical protein
MLATTVSLSVAATVAGTSIAAGLHQESGPLIVIVAGVACSSACSAGASTPTRRASDDERFPNDVRADAKTLLHHGVDAWCLQVGGRVSLYQRVVGRIKRLTRVRGRFHGELR